MELRPASCEQAARFVSLDLDGELSRFERALLKRHLGRCAPCAEEALRTAALTALLRSVPLEEMSVPVGVSRPRSSRLAVIQSVAAVAFVAVAGSWFGLSMADRRPSRPAVHVQAQPTAAKVVASDDRFDWQAGGPARGQRFVQFVPGGLHMSDW
jgi:putative zinc finger protein